MTPSKEYEAKKLALTRLIYTDIQEFPVFLSYKGELIERSALPEIILRELEEVEISQFLMDAEKDRETHVGEKYEDN